MTLQIPSLLETVQNAVTPMFFKKIYTEHQAIKTAKNPEELHDIGKRQLSVQLAMADQLLETQADQAGTGTALSQVRSDIATVSYALSERLQEGNAHLISGFNLVIETLQQSVELQLEETQLLTNIGNLLSSPYEVRARELRDKADLMFQSCLRKANGNQAENLHTCLDIYTRLTEDAVGKVDYLVWFQIGWLQWQVENDLAAAKAAFHHAQRLSEMDDNDAFQVKSLRHLALMQHLLGESEAAWLSAHKALAIGGPSADLHQEAALYCANTGRTDATRAHIQQALHLNPLLFIHFSVDPDFNSPQVHQVLVAEESALRTKVAQLLAEPRDFLGEVYGILSQVDEQRYLAEYAQLKDKENAIGSAGYVELLQIRADVAKNQARLIKDTQQAVKALLEETLEQIGDLQHEQEKVLLKKDKVLSEALRTKRKATKKVKAGDPQNFAFCWFFNPTVAGILFGLKAILMVAEFFGVFYELVIDDFFYALFWAFALPALTFAVFRLIAYLLDRSLRFVLVRRSRQRVQQVLADIGADYESQLAALSAEKDAAILDFDDRIHALQDKQATYKSWWASLQQAEAKQIKVMG